MYSSSKFSISLWISWTILRNKTPLIKQNIGWNVVKLTKRHIYPPIPPFFFFFSFHFLCFSFFFFFSFLKGKSMQVAYSIMKMTTVIFRCSNFQPISMGFHSFSFNLFKHPE
ncbi:Uncharacterized protein TCM_000574 [Theobroma cacao]|uniref:Uncharacterized protein n=1 Tax=Theobroma cacao TaxID=3641 RepID=A0A061DGU5_THECC|nr:Uncharacterized protein TCM_000574 [Theobroma cacao]